MPKSQNYKLHRLMPQGLKIGALLDHGKYSVEEVLGQGGSGIIFPATDFRV